MLSSNPSACTPEIHTSQIYLAKEDQKTSLPHLQSKCIMLISEPSCIYSTNSCNNHCLGSTPLKVKTRNASTLGASGTNFQGKMKAYIQSCVDIHAFCTSSFLTRGRAVASFTPSTLEPDGRTR